MEHCSQQPFEWCLRKMMNDECKSCEYNEEGKE